MRNFIMLGNTMVVPAPTGLMGYSPGEIRGPISARVLKTLQASSSELPL